MKKKYRKVVCFTLNGIISLIVLPFILLAYLGRLSEAFLFDIAMKPCDRLKTKLRVYDYDAE